MSFGDFFLVFSVPLDTLMDYVRENHLEGAVRANTRPKFYVFVINLNILPGSNTFMTIPSF